jgi:hypothetical protein
MAGLAAIVVASMTIDVRRILAAAPREAITPLKPSAALAALDSAMYVVFVAQRADCNGNLLLANLAATGRVKHAVHPPELVIAGVSQDTVGIRPLLPYGLRHSPIRLLAVGERLWLHAIGHHETPTLLIYDREQRLRLASHVDPDPVARVALGRAISHLVTNDPSH